MKQKIWRRCREHKLHRGIKIGLSLMLVGLVVRSLPYLAAIDAKDLKQDTVAIEFSDRNGLALGTVLTHDQEHTAVAALNQISPQFINAIIAAEDGRFYDHGALEMRAIGRSLLQAIKAKRVVSGASTITMQLARMLDPVSRSFGGKIQEIWLSWRLAAGMSKDEILAAYINRLPMGGNIYGVEAAAGVYFGIPAAELNLAQASLLAGLPNNPTYLNPYDYWEAAKRRQQYVLNRMVKDGYITSTQANQAERSHISLLSRRQGIVAAPHFLFWLYKSVKQTQFTDCATPCAKLSHVVTTIDRPLQQFVEAQVQQVVRSLAPNNVQHGAAVVIDNHTGEVLAYVGSPDYFSEVDIGRNDGVQALRQPGSTLKPFLYELALENRVIRPNTILADVPTHYAIPGAKLYSPQDYNETFQGPVRVRVALANSLNVPAVRVLERLGVPIFLQRLHQLGFEHLTHPPEYYGLGLTLGSGEVSLWQLARAYVTMARLGQRIAIKTTLQLQTTSALQPLRATSPSTWGLITDILSDRYARAKAFGVESVLSLPFPAAVKTGTSSNFRDTWTVGFTEDYTVATWVGNFNGEPMKKVSGVMGAAPLWNRIMLHLHEHQEPATFEPPTGLVQRPICAISGLRPTPACPTVVQEYFYPEDLSDYQRQPDTFYRVVSPGQYRLNLPPEYNEWLAMQQRSRVTPGGVKIVSPRNDDVFVLYPNNQGSEQRLEFKLAAMPTKPVEWWLNGQKLATGSFNSWFWSLSPGNWTLEVRSGNLSDRVNFQVQLAENQPTRRGFSLRN